VLARVFASHYGSRKGRRSIAGSQAAGTQEQSAPAPEPNVLLVDPPRKGLDTPVLALLMRRGLGSVTRLVYLSCGFEALRRDADVLLGGGWRLASARAFLFFPGTDAVETLAVFDRE
jgi:tRNA/tmRNA/rRNA uracil-C5-methylase (TrmA/RlmC/RlmD family)